MLSKEPNGRPDSVLQVRDELLQSLERSKDAPKPIAPPNQREQFENRAERSVNWTWGLLIGVLVGAIWGAFI